MLWWTNTKNESKSVNWGMGVDCTAYVRFTESSEQGAMALTKSHVSVVSSVQWQ